jgi:anti-sigma B factor antagonist
MAFPLTGNASRRMNIFSCGVDFHGECAVAYLRGELDSCTVEHLVDRLCPLAMAGQDIVVDLSGLQFVATAGLTALDELERHASAAGGSIRLTDPPPPMRRVLAVTGMRDRFHIVGHTVEARTPARIAAHG